MLASVAGAVAGWAIFSVVTVDVATKNKRVSKDTTITQEVPQFNWYFLEQESYDCKTQDEKEAKKIGTDWLNQQTPTYCDEKIINFKNYWKLPLFSINREAALKSWIRNPFILKNTKDPKGWYCVSKSVYLNQFNFYWYAQYELFYHQFNN